MKACKYCGSELHTSLHCFARPRAPLKARKAINRIGKVGAQWIEDRYEWIKNNPPDSSGFWYCYLRITPECPYRLTRETLTLDHVKGRGRHPESRRDQSNFKPACGPCNKRKGSKDLEEVTDGRD